MGNASHRTYSVGGHYLYGRLKFFQIAHLKHILKNTIGTLFSKKDNGKGMMKPLEVISIAVGGAVGVGNIGGVATAIAVGGPGAAFWIWVAAFLGMMMKMAEVSLGGILPFKG